MKESKRRILEKLAFRYWRKNNKRSAKQNWLKAVKLLKYIDKRKTLLERLLK
jgi:hypothetical protein